MYIINTHTHTQSAHLITNTLARTYDIHAHTLILSSLTYTQSISASNCRGLLMSNVKNACDQSHD